MSLYSCPKRHREIDWLSAGEQLNALGYALIQNLIPDSTCNQLKAQYSEENLYRSTVRMARYSFGRGEYKYYRYPLPDFIQRLRTSLYPNLAATANQWCENLNLPERFPNSHAEYIESCSQVGQLRPTPLILKYRAGDYNCLHQDLYGDLVFPLQIAIMLDVPDQDFTGGEFVLTEQRPRMQSRVTVVPIKKGDMVIFPVNERPVKGTRGFYRVKMRHGVSQVHSGTRHVVGIIFHDAK